jgi:heme/copper-type cytochrome/quinol oxidase subunit 4
MEITACPVCGSKNIGIGTLGDGIISGLSSWNEVCRNCGYQGPSLVFESEAQYTKFLEALSYQKQQAEAQAKQSGEEKTEQKQDKKATIDSGKKSYAFEFIVSVVLTIVFFIILSGSNYLGMYSNVLSQNDLGTLVLFIVASFVGILVFFFLLIALGETLIRSIRWKKK